MTLDTDPGKLSRYTLKCEIKKVRETFQHALSRNQRETSCVILIPELNDQMLFFLAAWLPEEQQIEGEHREILVDLAYPYSLAQRRIALLPADRRCPTQPYLFVMDEDMEKLLEAREGEKIHVRTYPDGVDQQLTMSAEE